MTDSHGPRGTAAPCREPAPGRLARLAGGLLAMALVGACSSALPTDFDLDPVAILATPTIEATTGQATPAPVPRPTATPSPTPPGSPRPTATAPTPPAPGGRVRLMAVGDVMLARDIGQLIGQRGAGEPFRHVSGIFDSADLVVANLECAISDRGSAATNKRYTFRAPVGAVDALVEGGIDLVSLANNHALDYGPEAFTHTMGLLDERGIGYAGGGLDRASAYGPRVLTVNGLRIAFLGYVLPFSSTGGHSTRQWEAAEDRPGLAIGRPEQLGAEVARARELADVVVVLVHGGIEYRAEPSAAQRRFAHAAVAAGAALVVGHHPHVLQGYARRGKALIAYSTGNFVFDRMTTTRASDSAILDVTLSADGVESFEWIPVVLRRGTPRPATGTDARRILARLPELGH